MIVNIALRSNMETCENVCDKTPTRSTLNQIIIKKLFRQLCKSVIYGNYFKVKC